MPLVVPQLLSMLAACGAGPEPDRVVQIESNVGWTEWLTLLHGWSPQSADGNTAILLLRPGSMLVSEEAIVPYYATDGGALDLHNIDGRIELAGTVISLNVSRDSAVTWLGRASPAELEALRSVYVKPSADLVNISPFERLAEVNPGVALFFESREPAEAILPFFRPSSLWVEEGIAWAPQEAPWLQEVESLWATAPSPGSLDVLPWLSQLRSLYLEEWDVAAAGPLPVGLSGLESLSLGEVTDLVDTSAFGPAVSTVQELSIAGESEVDVSILDGFSNLRSLILTDAEWTAPSDLAGLEGLRRLGMPRNATQEDFAAIVQAHPDLEYLEVVGVDDVTDLSPLRELTRLRAVVLNGAFENIEVLEELQTLHYVGVPAGVWDNTPQRVADLRAALPEAAFAKVEEFCLGSGWILLLLPVVLLFAYRRARSGHA